jgi:hypothetical protein
MYYPVKMRCFLLDFPVAVLLFSRLVSVVGLGAFLVGLDEEESRHGRLTCVRNLLISAREVLDHDGSVTLY